MSRMHAERAPTSIRLWNGNIHALGKGQPWMVQSRERAHAAKSVSSQNSNRISRAGKYSEKGNVLA